MSHPAEVTQSGPREWMIQGAPLSLPVKVRDARLAFSIYRYPAAAARDALAGTPFRPLALGRTALSAVVFVRYLDGDLGNYDEFGIGTVVRGIKGPPGIYVHHLPVTAEFTMYAGRWIWGLPKYLVKTGCEVGTGSLRLDLRTDDNVIVTGDVKARLRVPGRFSLPSTGWSTGLEGETKGAILRTPGRMRLREVRVGARGPQLSWGEHPLAEQALALRLDRKPLFTMTARAELSIDAAVVVPRT
jgi:hypothetical protein